MTKAQARNQALAASGAALTAFIGVCHEAVGTTIFPWGPALFGGPIGWHAVGILCIALGLGLLAGTLRLVPFPVVRPAIALAVGAAAITVFTALVHREFHVFALTLAGAGVVMAICHPKSAA